MDIYKYAKEIDYMADYFDHATGNVYKIQEYGEALKNATSEKEREGVRIRVYDITGHFVGFANKEKK